MQILKIYQNFKDLSLLRKIVMSFAHAEQGKMNSICKIGYVIVLISGIIKETKIY